MFFVASERGFAIMLGISAYAGSASRFVIKCSKPEAKQWTRQTLFASYAFLLLGSSAFVVKLVAYGLQ